MLTEHVVLLRAELDDALSINDHLRRAICLIKIAKRLTDTDRRVALQGALDAAINTNFPYRGALVPYLEAMWDVSDFTFLEALQAAHDRKPAPVESKIPTSDLTWDVGPENARQDRVKGLSLYRKGNLEEALEAFDNALRVHPTDGRALERRSEILLRLERFEDALEDLRRLAQGNNLKYVYLYITTLLRLKRFDEALEKLDKSDSHASLVSSQSLRGLVLLGLSRHNDALKVFLRIFSQPPGRQHSISESKNAAFTQVRNQQFGEAIKIFDRLPSNERDLVSIQIWKGFSFFMELRLDEAAEIFNRARSTEVAAGDSFLSLDHSSSLLVQDRSYDLHWSESALLGLRLARASAVDPSLASSILSGYSEVKKQNELDNAASLEKARIEHDQIRQMISFLEEEPSLGIITLPDTRERDSQQFGQQNKKTLPDADRKTDQLLNDWLSAKGVAESARPALITKITHLVSPIPRALWDEREKYPELAHLNAPRFLRAVYPDAIDAKGKLSNEDVVRLSDPRLVQAVQSYILARKDHVHGLGDAEGLIFTQRDGRGRPKKSKARKKGQPARSMG